MTRKQPQRLDDHDVDDLDKVRKYVDGVRSWALEWLDKTRIEDSELGQF